MIEALGAIDRMLVDRGQNAGSLPGVAPGQTIGPVGPESFADALAGVAGNAVSRLQQAEGVSMKALQGDADIREVVDAVMSAEQSLQAAIAIRDKIVTAYLEISRMAI
jgi:flagellar hook-basal body complex protein FliE